MERLRRCLNFDLNQELLSMYYGKSNTQAYHEITKCLENLMDIKFSHRQGSGYVSIDNLEFTDIVIAVRDMQQKLPWFNKCVSSIDVTSAGRVFDLTSFESLSHMNQNMYEQGLLNKRRAFHFDLSTELLKQYFSATSPNNAYMKIQNFMEEHGFEHRQGSGYLSYRPISVSQALNIFEQMKKELPWLMNCVEKMDLTEAERVFDLKPYFEVAEMTKDVIGMEDVLKDKEIGYLVSYFDNETGLEGELFANVDFGSSSVDVEKQVVNTSLELLAEKYPNSSFTITSQLGDKNVSLAYELADAMNEYGMEGLSQTELFMDSVPYYYDKIVKGDVASQIAFLKDKTQTISHRQDDPDFGVEGKITKLIKNLEDADKSKKWKGTRNKSTSRRDAPQKGTNKEKINKEQAR